VARLDIWNYKDDYLQPYQLKNLQRELKRSYLAVIRPNEGSENWFSWAMKTSVT
jgi:hypothetical protein